MDRENFDKLVSGMSIEERQNLLSKMKIESTLSTEYLYVPDDGIVPRMDAKAEYNKLPWYSRFWYFILSIFKSKTPDKIFADDQVSVLGSKINEKYPGMYDFERGLLLPSFLKQMTNLKEAARFFYLALDVSVNRDRGAFFAFLGSLEMPEIHKRLNDETDPKLMSERHPGIEEAELRQIAIKAMDDTLKTLTDEQRVIMYQNARSLFCLKELSVFLYDRVIMAFSNNKAVNGDACSVNTIRDLLVSLSNILLSLKTVPSMPLLKSLFVFMLQEKADEPDFDINKEIRILLTKAEAFLGIIREFNSKVPLIHIIRCATRNSSFYPHEISGGEDWFLYYKDYWKKRLESFFSSYLKDSRQRQILRIFEHFFKDKEPKLLEHCQSDANNDGFPLNESFSLSFILTFYSIVFMPEINPILRPILIDGEFEKKENRVEFAEAYNNFIKLDDEIAKLDMEISPEGDYGKRYNQVRQEMTSLPVKRRKTQMILEDAAEDAEKIISGAGEAARTIVDVLTGILGKDAKGKYAGLTNLSVFTKKDNLFIYAMDDTVEHFKKVLSILDDMASMESGI
ncbi:MAG: DUF5312 domain-containing protein [Treponema sp.]|nr:DUF5312 domain-containing protein [Treponema sp.]